MIRVAAYKGKSWVSKAIKWQTWGNYSHIGIILPDGKIVEAWQGTNNVRIINHLGDGHAKGTEVDIYHVPMTDEQEHKFTQEALSCVGKKYDYWGIVGFLARKHYANDDKFFCSELFAHCCKVAGTPYFRFVEPYKVSPQRAVLGIFHKVDTVVTL